jgi:hypothetical protein
MPYSNLDGSTRFNMNSLFSLPQLSLTLVRGLRKNCLRGLVLLTLVVQSGVTVAETSRIAVISDINGRYGSTDYHPRLANAISRIIELKPNLVISTGDMVAGQRPSPKLTRAELDEMWQRFHQDIRTPLEEAGIPVLMTPGNHDASGYPGYELERDTYTDYHLNHPPTIRPLPGGNFPYHFATAYAGMLLVSLDATRIGALEPAQLNWLSRTLQRERNGPTILFGHLPLQAVSQGRENDIITDPELEALLVSTGISAYLSGHHHAWYPGLRLDTPMLSMGNLGGNQRGLLGTGLKTGFSFAMLELDEAGIRSIKAYKGPEFKQVIDNQSLPGRLASGLQRLDTPVAE